MSTSTDAGLLVPEWTLADRLRKARQASGMKQREFAEALGVPTSRYGQWEAGNNGPRDLVSVALRIELLTRVPASWILGVYESPRPGGPDEGVENDLVRHQGLEPRTRWFGVSRTDELAGRRETGPRPIMPRPRTAPMTAPAAALDRVA